MSDSDVKVLYEMLDIDGRKVVVFECGQMPTEGLGNPDVGALVTRTFNTDNTHKNVYYQASDTSVQWFKGPFFVSKTPPTREELAFQLREWPEAADLPRAQSRVPACRRIVHMSIAVLARSSVRKARSTRAKKGERAA
jgi:hypothetical protein